MVCILKTYISDVKMLEKSYLCTSKYFHPVLVYFALGFPEITSKIDFMTNRF